MGPLSRAAILLLDPTASPDTQWVRATITFGSWDSLGAGALLALLARQTSGGMLELRSQLKPALAVGMVAGLAVLAADFYLFHWAAWFVLGDLVMTVPLAWLVVGGATGFGGVGGRVLRWRPLLFIGLISYGVYLLHPFALVFLERLAKLLGIGFPASGIEAFALTTALSVFVAALSWRFFEAPINRMKRHLPYETASMVRGSAREQTSENAAAPDRTGG